MLDIWTFCIDIKASTESNNYKGCEREKKQPLNNMFMYITQWSFLSAFKTLYPFQNDYPHHSPLFSVCIIYVEEFPIKKCVYPGLTLFPSFFWQGLCNVFMFLRLLCEWLLCIICAIYTHI